MHDSPSPHPAGAAVTSCSKSNPFDLGNQEAYNHWKNTKLLDYPGEAAQLVVPVSGPDSPASEEIVEIKNVCRKTNMAIYELDPSRNYSKREIAQLARKLGLTHLDCNLLSDEDCITTLRHYPAKSKRGYIPYSNRRINWHTDGYYNKPDEMIHGMLLHCEQPAVQGGENALLDHEIVYIGLRDWNPDYVRLLMQADAMTIPENIEPGTKIRDASTGPVFSVTPEGNLHMRYTARTHSIQWKENTWEAVSALEKILIDDCPWKFRVKLKKGQGLICNNVLHTRTDFDQNIAHSERLLYRARYFDRIEDTNIDPIY